MPHRCPILDLFFVFVLCRCYDFVIIFKFSVDAMSDKPWDQRILRYRHDPANENGEDDFGVDIVGGDDGGVDNGAYVAVEEEEETESAAIEMKPVGSEKEKKMEREPIRPRYFGKSVLSIRV